MKNKISFMFLIIMFSQGMASDSVKIEWKTDKSGFLISNKGDIALHVHTPFLPKMS